MSIRHLLISAAILAAIIIAPVRAALAHELCFAGKTAYCLNDPFADYWEANGALPVFGYPITAAASEENADTGQPYLTQWLERNRMEDHPDNAGTPYRVLLGLLGKERLAQLGRSIEAPEAGPKAGCLWFKETGHNVCDQAAGLGFKTYWETHGLKISGLDRYGRSLQLFGLPLSSPHMETNSSGDTVLTQWFERARFEWHPNNPSEYKVLLGLLGSEVLANRPPTVDSVQVYAVVLDVGGPVGCGDRLVALERRVPRTPRPLAAAMKQLLALEAQPAGNPPLYNALAQSALSFDSAAIDAQGVATINLMGQLQLGGVCDVPRVREQLRATALQFPTVREARFFINGVPLEDLLSSR
jgi:hypothetical protein